MMISQVYFVLSVLFVSFLHPYHVSIFDIDHDDESKTLQIAIRVFTDDLEDALEEEGYEKVKLGTVEEADSAGAWVQMYMSEHITIKANGEPITLNYIGREVEKELTWCYIESNKIDQLNLLEVESDLLMATFDDQTNLVHINANGVKRSMVLKRSRLSEIIEY